MKTVVILLSDKRSGSTMFQREICKHPEVRTVDYSPHTYLETHHWLKGAVILDKPSEIFAGGKIYQGYGTKANARAYLVDGVVKNIPDFEIPEDDNELIFKGWEALCERYARPVFFEKSPQILAQWASLSLLLEWINTTDYDVKIIGLTRNPLAVQYSAYNLFHTNPQKRQFGWLETQKNLLAFKNLLPRGSFFHVKYEDIVNSPDTTFCEIFKFIGVTEFRDKVTEAHKESLTKWKDDPYFTLQLDDSVKQIASYFGYTATELYNPPKPPPPLLWQMRRKLKGKVLLFLARLRYRVLIPFILRKNK